MTQKTVLESYLLDFKRSKGLPLNLQMFAEEVDGANEAGANDTADEADNESGELFEAITNQSDFDSKVNKAVQSALDNQRKKADKETKDAIAKALEKEKSYSEMSEEERKVAELTDREAQLEKRASELEFKELLADISTDLASKELPVKFAETLAVAGDKEKSLVNVTEFEKEFKSHVAEGVKKALRQSDPGTGAGGSKQTNYGAELAKNTAGNKKPF